MKKEVVNTWLQMPVLLHELRAEAEAVSHLSSISSNSIDLNTP